MTPFKPGDHLEHKQFGMGRVEFDKGDTVLVRFAHGIEECEKIALEVRLTPLQAVQAVEWHSPIEVIVRSQANAIQSINDTWGVFALSRIALLPHQLWVCRRVVEQWPTRWLVADDVGLGKTIEGGLILSSLLARGVVQRILIVAPASLVNQWQQRLRTMFDIRFSVYSTEVDQPKLDYWNTHNQVVVSLQTIRMDHNGRLERLLESEPWDFVVVDEAHHLNADEKSGPTLGYTLLEQLTNAGKIRSMVFFTGTPHRGKNYGFLSLLHLLDSSIDPQRTMQEQLSKLPAVMIRNNKQNVTDLRGNRLFQPPKVQSETYTYSPAEENFYRKLTEFIITGQAYANSLASPEGRVVILVLITMQKLASSSVSAVRKALRGRLERIQLQQQHLREVEGLLSDLAASEQYGDLDETSRLEERMVELSDAVHLMENEIPRLQELIHAADQVVEETKFQKILAVLQSQYIGRSVLFFTEYKATQAQLMSVLMQHFGDDCVTFINGDDRIDDVTTSRKSNVTLSLPRERAVEKFLNGEVRFLVSTEAGGEGIDLQEQCNTLIHVDLPWNPMRLHQRVGRLNRYGQQKQVEVMTLRNPDTVEALIWDKLNSKIENIKLALNQVMDEPEDLLQLVLGMTSPSLFNEIFGTAVNTTSQRLDEWFDQKTAQFGGRDVIQAVRDLIGNAARFDFQQVSEQLPQVDLKELSPFFATMLQLNNRRIREDEDGIAFKTPDVWMRDMAVRRNYEKMVYDRTVKGNNATARILGVGNRVMNAALEQARAFPATVATVPSSVLPQPLIVFKVYDRITGQNSFIQTVIVGIEINPDQPDEYRLLLDWQLLVRLNEIIESRNPRRLEKSIPPIDRSSVERSLMQATNLLQLHIQDFSLPFLRPETELLSLIWPTGDAT